jgi:hypothetical protein
LYVVTQVEARENCPVHLWIERNAMTAPRSSQWHLTPPLRLAAVALALAGLSFMVEGWLATLLWVGALVLLVWAAVKFAKVYRRGSRNV